MATVTKSKTKTSPKITVGAIKVSKLTKTESKNLSKTESKRLTKAERVKMLHDKTIAKRDEKIMKLYETGKHTYQAIADKMGMSKSWVWEIIKENKLS